MAVATFALVGAYIWVKMFGLLAKRQVLSQYLSRKLIHITSAPLFLASWAFFSAEPTARFVAAIVPLMQVVRLGLTGAGIIVQKDMVGSISRSGDTSELLGGPFWYSITLVLVRTVRRWVTLRLCSSFSSLAAGDSPCVEGVSRRPNGCGYDVRR